MLILLIGLFLIGVASYWWIKISVREKHLEMLNLLAAEISDNVLNDSGDLHVEPQLRGLIMNRERVLNLKVQPFIFIINKSQQIIFSEPNQSHDHHSFHFSSEISGDAQHPVPSKTDEARIRGHFYVIKKQIVSGSSTVGMVVIMYPRMEIAHNKEQILYLLIMLGSLALLGWGVIYLLTRKLSDPIKNVADAAKQIVSGNYWVDLNKSIKERELHELVQSFKDMANRLRQMEMMRTELLAGVTHELKTPVASMSGLIQAVKDGVVSGEEADEFLEISLKEADKLQKMVEDLLDFNSFVVGAVEVNKERYDLVQIIREMLYQWSIVQENQHQNIRLNTQYPEAAILVETDTVRIQQILYNLLNNSKQSLNKEGRIDITLHTEGDKATIEVRDNGSGIPEPEQAMIFERFYRGTEKKKHVRGLGLGLSFSRMLARTLGGDLILKESNSSGSVFQLILPLAPVQLNLNNDLD